MKVFRMIGMFLMATFLCVNLSSCSDDDDEEGGGVAGLEGTWGLTNDQGWEIYEGQKDEWNDSYDPRNPDEARDDIKIEITKAGDKTYNVKYYVFDDGGWFHEDDARISVEGSAITLTYLDEPDYPETGTFSLNNNQLVFELREGDHFYNKMTFIRM